MGQGLARRNRRHGLTLPVLFALVTLLSQGAGCRETIPPASPGSRQPATAMGDWASWHRLTPLIEIARTHAPPSTVAVMERASELLAEGKARSADGVLAEMANSDGRHWIAVARADLVALHFTVCIRGIAWRLQDLEPDAPYVERRMDYSEDTRIQAGDLSVEALLTNLDDAMASEIPPLVTQARIARARVTAFASRCPPNAEVQRRAEGILEQDLATLAAEGHLTPDLAFLWGGVQMRRYSSTAARPFLLQAREGGFDDPSVTYMLAVVALDNRELEQAEALAIEAGKAHAAAGNTDQQAQSEFLQGEIARARKQPEAAREHYQATLELVPDHGAALLAMAELEQQTHGALEAQEYLHAALPRLLLEGELDAEKAEQAASRLEAMVILCEQPQLAQMLRDALLLEIEQEPDAMRRGLRYFFAATLEVRLREYQVAHGHAVLAREEFEESELPAPVDVAAFLDRLGSAA